MKRIIINLIFIVSVICASAQENPVQKKIKWLEGTWEGTGYQIDNQSWHVSFTHMEKKFSIAYISLGCSGWWKISKCKKGHIVFIENITNNNGCDQGDKVVVTKVDDKNICVAWFIPKTFGDQCVAFSVLQKKQ